MMATGGTQQSLRNVLGALKDSTTVGLAKVNSEFKDLDVAIVRASNHVEKPAKEKHIQAIFMAVSASRPRADVTYCIHALARRLHKTRNWAVALKTLIVIHRALREVDLTFCEELIIYSRRRGHVLNMAHFKDDSGPQAWDYSAWVRSYALFLEERLECFRVLKYDINRERLRTKDVEAVELLEQLPALQQLLSRLLSCQPQGAASYNFVIQLALTMVAGESIKIYNAISDGTINLVDKFFEMPHAHAVKAIEIYRRSGSQAESLSKFYDMCKSLNLGRGEKYMKVDQPPASFLTAMEDYVREIPRTSSVRRNSEADKLEAPKVILAIEYKTEPEVQEAPAEVPAPVEEPVEVVEEPKSETVDLLGLKEESPEAAALYEKNALALAIVPVEVTKSPQMTTSTTGWELALVTTPSDNTSALVESKLAGGLDKLTLDSLYEDAMSRKGNQSYGSSAPNPFESQTLDPFYASTAIAPPQAVQMASLAQQQHTFMWQQQQHQMMILSHHQQQSMNPFGNPYGGMGLGANPYGVGMPVQASYSSYGGLI